VTITLRELRVSAARLDRSRVVAIAAIVIVLVIQLIWFPMPFGLWIRGLVLGLLNAMLAIGMALIYRANRIINFAQADLGTVPASFVTAFILFWGWSYWLGLATGIVLAIITGVVIEFALVRRFRTAPRLVLTVATLGISQLMVLVGILIPRWWGKNTVSERLPPPFDWKFTPSWQWRFWEPTLGSPILNAHDLVALIVAPIAMLGVAWFLSRSRWGVAVRANAERTDRAAMLGLPVSRLDSIVWSMATLLAFLALFIRSGIIGVPLGFAAGLPALLLALAALVVGRLERLPTIAAAAVAFGILDYGVRYSASSPAYVYPIVAAVIFTVLLVQPSRALRRDDATSSWRGAEEIRPLPDHLAAHPAVATVRWTLIALAVLGLVLLPRLFAVDITIKATAAVIYAIILLSLVVLTGWSGQISLGQMALVGTGAAVSTALTSRWNVDLTLSLALAAAAGGVTAFVVGLPALRLRGLYLAVTTFAFGLAAQQWLLNDDFFGWFPSAETRVERPPLFGRIDVSTPTRYYAYSVVILTLVYLGLRGVRRSEVGRTIVAVRENERAAQSFAVPVVRARLTAFVLSGAVAGVGGGLLAHLAQGFSADTYGPGDSLQAFTGAVVGGLGALAGALFGAAYLRGILLIRAPEWQLVTSGVGVLFVLLVLPGGLLGLWARVRDVLVGKLTGTRPDQVASGDPMPTTTPPAEAAAPDPVEVG
jgi:branched-chain amino acid transport system permease protein